MSAPKSILKKPSGSKPKHSVSLGAASSALKSAPPKGVQAGRAAKPVAKPAPARTSKKARVQADEDEDDDMSGGDEAGEGDGSDEDGEAGTDEEIERAKKGKAKATPKRKRPTTADDFGSALTTLLAESSRPIKSKPKGGSVKDSKAEQVKVDATSSAPAPAPSASASASASASGSKPRAPPKPSALPILSLSRAPLPPSVAESKLERRAARELQREKEEKEDRARVRDVVEGWSHLGAQGEVVGGLEFEKGLRKTAQRGVIKLFNAILTAHKHSEENDLAMPSSASASNKLRDAPIPGVKGRGKKDRDNVLGRGSREELTKEGFLELVKRGTA